MAGLLYSGKTKLELRNREENDCNTRGKTARGGTTGKMLRRTDQRARDKMTVAHRREEKVELGKERIIKNSEAMARTGGWFFAGG